MINDIIINELENIFLFENIKKVEEFEEFKINKYNWQSNNFKDPIIFKFRPSKSYRYREFNYFQIEYKGIIIKIPEKIFNPQNIYQNIIVKENENVFVILDSENLRNQTIKRSVKNKIKNLFEINILKK